MAEVLKKFGRYFLLDQIAQGGMAEIYRARLASPDGAGRLLVIKRIQASYGSNAEFQRMFKSEIKVTMGFNHPNIVQLYDFGEEQGQPYIAMEFVDGRNLRQFLSRTSELKQPFPIEIAGYIIEQAASGLHYAHCYKDKITGQHLSIVHRDISPQNILISYEGNAKIIDFGIAKASTNSESTRAGVIKGKPSYLSPEQISGDPLDGRCDVFALGIVLWELLAGKKLFAGENDLAVLKLIESCNQHVKPPSTFNPKVPKELDYIVLKALAKQREKRFQTGEELQRALHKFLYTFSPDFNPSDLSYYAKELFQNEIVEDRKRLQKLSEKAEQLLSAEILDSLPPLESGTLKKEDTTTIVEPKLQKPAPSPTSQSSFTNPFDGSAAKGAKVEIDMSNVKSTASARSRSKASGVVHTSSAPSHPSTTDARSMGSSRMPAPKQKVEASGGGSSLKYVLIGIIGFVAIAAVGPQFGLTIPLVSEFFVANKPKTAETNSNTGTNSSTVAAEPVVQQANTKAILLRLNLLPGGGNVALSLNGKKVDGNMPIVQVALDSPLELVAERAGFKPFRREFVLSSEQVGGLREWLMDVPLEPLRFGYLTLRSTPSADATIVIDGKPWVRKTPIENEKMPVGTYFIKLTNEVLGMEKTIDITVQEGKAISLDERLEIKR